MKKLFVSLALVCALASWASAGGTHMPGLDPTPTPTPEDVGTQSAASPEAPEGFVWILVDGAWLLMSIT